MLKKGKTACIVAVAVFLIINVIFFTGIAKIVAAHLITYALLVFSLLALVVVAYIEKEREERLKISMLSLATGYFLFQTVLTLSLIFMGGLLSVNLIAKIVIVGQILIAIAYIAFMIITYFSNLKTEHELALHDKGVCFVKSCAARVKPLLSTIEDKNARKHVEKAYDILFTSPVATVECVSQVENDIEVKTTELLHAANEEKNDKVIALADEIVALTKARNEALKICH